MHDSLGAGAAGFLLKDVSPERLAEGIWAAERGELVIDPRVTRVALALARVLDRVLTPPRPRRTIRSRC